DASRSEDTDSFHSIDPMRPPGPPDACLIITRCLGWRLSIRRLSRRRCACLGAATDHLLGVLRDLRHVERDILRLPIAHYGDVGAAGCPECCKDFLPGGRIIERCAVDGRDEIARAEAEPHKRLPVATGVNAVAALL